MKHVPLCLIASLLIAAASCPAQMKDYPILPVSFTAVRIQDDFWQPRLETNRMVTIPFAFRKCEETGRVQNFVLAGKVNSGAIASGKFHGTYPFDDSDVFKIIEGASYSLSLNRDPGLARYLDSLVVLIASAQEKDGYLYTNRTMDPAHAHPWAGKERWLNDRMNASHELYNVGHLYEAAVAHYVATGKRSLLDVATKNADLLCTVFGPDKLRTAPGHEEVEIGLVKLYRVTGEKKYLELARFFVEQRGRLEPRGESYNQDHIPVTEQTEAVGHAVRAGYLYAAVADIAALLGDDHYLRVIDRIWENVVMKKMYITGGIGSRHEGEAFGDAYDLPNLTAYNETCAAIANVYWNHRMFLLHGDSRYIDVLERSLYNNVLAGVSFDGMKFFYTNPLESDGSFPFNMGETDRQEWFSCSCCPSNLARFIASVAGYVYAVQGDRVYANLFAGGMATVEVKKTRVEFQEETRYPWEGDVMWTIRPEKATRFALCIRIPGWAGDQPLPGDLYRFSDKRGNGRGISIKVNGKPFTPREEMGYAVVERDWRADDIVEYHVPMPVRKVYANIHIGADKGRVCLQRGPLVYCAEGVDNSGVVENIIVPRTSEIRADFRTDLLNGVVALSCKAFTCTRDDERGVIDRKESELVAVPYYAWNHRGKGTMAVWFRSDHESLPPIVSQPSTLFFDSLLVTIMSYTEGKLQYTLDGTDPVKQGRRYTTPIHFSSAATLKAVVINPVTGASDEVVATYAPTTLHRAASIKNPSPGVSCEYYEGSWEQVGAFRSIAPKKTITVRSIDRAQAERKEYYGLIFSGYLSIPRTGIYTFQLRSNDGSLLTIDGENLIDNDGVHESIQKTGQIALEAGFHPFVLLYFQGGGDAVLDLTCEGPGLTKGRLPAEMLAH